MSIVNVLELFSIAIGNILNDLRDRFFFLFFFFLLIPLSRKVNGLIGLLG